MTDSIEIPTTNAGFSMMTSLIKVQPTDRACERSVSGAENGAERAKTRVERSGSVSGSQKNRAERSGA